MLSAASPLGGHSSFLGRTIPAETTLTAYRPIRLATFPEEARPESNQSHSADGAESASR
jgi:hypothetical protein